VFIICYSVISPSSVANVRNKWAPEIKLYGAGVPIILVGTKSDLRHDSKVIAELEAKNIKAVTFEEGEALAKEIGATKHMECSAFTQDNLPATFDEVIRAGLEFISPKKKKTKRRPCVIM
jgi:GTPase SAR1 family protein